MKETNKVGHVKLFNEIEALAHEMNKFGFVTPIFVVKSELTQMVPLKAPNFWKFMVCLYDPSTLMYRIFSSRSPSPTNAGLLLKPGPSPKEPEINACLF